jgi:phospholipid transport system substrate-binding protein
MKNLARVATVAMALAATQAIAAPADPLEFVRARYAEIQGVVKANPDQAKMRQGIRDVMETFVDYRELSRRTLVGDWDKLKPKERDAFVSEFKRMIQRTYVRRFNPDTEVAIEYRGVKPGDEGTTTVESVVHSGRSEARVDYRLHEQKGRWWAFDVVIDDVSMVQNYRKQFHDIVAKSGFKGLMDKIRKKNEKAEE